MHKWNMFRRTAPIVLSLVVAATSMPTMALAADAFEDGTAVELVTEDLAATPETTEEADTAEAEEIPAEVIAEAEEVPDAEEILDAEEITDAEETAEEVSEEAAEDEEILFASEEDAAEVGVSDASTEGQAEVAGVTYDWKVSDAAVEGYTKIADTTVYYKTADGSTAPAADAYYYGTATLTYTEFYQGDTTVTEYDAVASSTTRKYQMFTNEDSTTPDDSGYKINGVKNVSVRVLAQSYAETEILKAADQLPASGVYAEADGITLASDPTAAVKQYKTLNADGTYSATTFNVVATVTDATAALNTSSNWGDYEIDITETTTKILRASSDEYEVGANLAGVILETASGKKVGLRHMEETWVKTYEVSFDVSYCDLQGETVTKITYTTPDSAYVFDFGSNGVYIKPQAPSTVAVTAEITSKTQIAISGISSELTNPEVQVSRSLGHHKGTSYLVEKKAVTPTNGKVTLTFDDDKVAMADTEYTVTVSSTNYADIQVKVTRTESDEWVYMYAGLTWAEYWANEGVTKASSTEAGTAVDSRNENDTGAFDAVTRATTNHGLHRGSYQCAAVIYDTDGNTYYVQSWNSATEAVLRDGSIITFEKGTITAADGSTHTMDKYYVTGLKYVPVKVNADDVEAFKAKYVVVENGGAMSGGYSEKNLSAYTATAAVDADTNGLKTATLQEDGSFVFSARSAAGTTSGLQDTALKTADMSSIVVTVKEADGSYGEFLRVDLTGSYGDLGAAMQAVRWDYYGSGDTVLASYGTKFAADNWMHKVNGIQLGLTNSLRCQLPDGSDGTGKWVLTIYALGYADTTITINATSENIVTEKADATEEEVAAAKAVQEKAEALTESEYTAETWAAMQTELQELKDALAKTTPKEADLNEAVSHLEAAIEALVKVTPEPTATPTPTVKPSITVKKSVINLKLKKSTTLKPVVTGIDGKVTYSSSNKKVATVNSKGKITAKKTGKAVITVKCGDYKTKVTVYVNEKLTLKKSSATIKVKGKTTIKATTNIKGTITYTSSNTKVATVTKKGVVKGVAKGTATITVKCNGKTKKFKVTVK